MTTTPMNQDQWRKQLRKFDVEFIELPTFANDASGRDDETGSKFGPVFGCGIHHTGDDAPDSLDRNVIVNGRSDLPGPLAHAGLRDDGVVEMVTTGRANHFGGGDPKVLAAVKNESYGAYPPDSNEHQGSAGSVDGNDSFYGLEVYYSGGKPMTKVQYEAAVGWAAAICDFHGWGPKSAIGHKEWSDWKIDPGNVDMAVFRSDVYARIHGVKEVAGPKHLTPNITAALKANVKYDKALDAITAKGFLPSVDEARKALKEQRRNLRAAERK